MKFVQGTKALRDHMGSRGESKFLKLDDGESVVIRFLQELDEAGATYNKERGLALGYYEHIDPDDFSTSFVCTAESEGKCAGCERVSLNRRWRARGRLIANVLVRGQKGDMDKVKIFTTPISSKGLTPTLVEFSDDYGSICDRDYKLTRRGTSIETTYTLLPKEVSPLTKTDEAQELTPLTSVMRNLSYDEQKELLGDGVSDW